jgi:FkbM family methyltransferase
MHTPTPFRQIGRIYSSILALGRWPAEATAQNQELTEAVRANAAATRELADQLRAAVPLQTTTSTLHSAAPLQERTTPTARLLEQFRRNLLSRIEPLLCVDVGARWGVDSALLLLKEKAKLLCFDPDEEECARLQVHHSLDEVEYVPLALSCDGRDLSLTVTRQPACSSIYPPVEALYTHYPALIDIEPVRVVSVPSISLDKFLAERGLQRPDLLKLDTQGSELDILQGAVNNLSAACMIDIEVEFNPIYGGQALFGEVDLFMRAHGFSLWRLPSLVHYAPETFPSLKTPLEAASHPGRRETVDPGNGQLFWAQAHYVRSDFLPASPSSISADFAYRAAAIASAYGYWDLALLVLEKCKDAAFEASNLRELLNLE